GLPDDWEARAARLGADVPACVRSSTCIGTGTGTELEYIDNDLVGMPVLLVNPRIPLGTGAVFKGWDGVDRGPLSTGTVSQIAAAGRNDLQQSAMQLCPIISEVLDLLGRTGARIVRMSGSGATCFALYEDDAALQIAAEMIREQRGDWWQMSGKLR
ncbi:MAG: 4-(cytidine 5'-diphospho)-2-C-methyl-D-erythritol kinase, partial [Novosphingobium sp.]